MALIVEIIGMICKIIAGAVSQELANEFKEWTCWIVERLVQRAVQRLPKEEQDRFGEEWRSHINDTPGQIGKVVVALGFIRAARKIAAMERAGYREDLPGDNFKRAIDVAASAAYLLLQAPLLGVIGSTLRLEGHGSVLVRQPRIGLCGRKFDMLKFRTAYSCEVGGTGSSTCGSGQRLARIGSFLRKTGLDLLPVGINVLRGDMSFIGPRPHHAPVAEQMSRSLPRYSERTKVRPGLIGWAQVRSSWDPISELADDIYYVRNRSLKLDFAIFARWFGVLGRRC
jgi:lipopolysaccharide/colanic/teichoic acid biosynthesis glycosyltransferase